MLWKRIVRFLLSAAVFYAVSEEPQTISAQAGRTSDNSSLPLPWVRRQGEAQASGVIVFVHGVLGNIRTTWSNGRSYWPELLTKDKTFDGQDIYVYGYPSPKLGKSFSIDEVAENLRLVVSTDGVLVVQNDHVRVLQHGWPGNASLSSSNTKPRSCPKFDSLFFSLPLPPPVIRLQPWRQSSATTRNSDKCIR